MKFAIACFNNCIFVSLCTTINPRATSFHEIVHPFSVVGTMRRWSLSINLRNFQLRCLGQQARRNFKSICDLTIFIDDRSAFEMEEVGCHHRTVTWKRRSRIDSEATSFERKLNDQGRHKHHGEIHIYLPAKNIYQTFGNGFIQIHQYLQEVIIQKWQKIKQSKIQLHNEIQHQQPQIISLFITKKRVNAIYSGFNLHVGDIYTI